jgi:probable F420-dependent oxidoreductase
MELGVFLPVSGSAAGPEVLTEAARQAEHLDYDSVWAAERLVNPWEVDTAYPYKEDNEWFVKPDIPFLEPLTVLTYLSAVTEDVMLGHSVAVLPYRHPLYMARIATSIDTLSNGRYIMGAGAGWMEEEFDALNIPFEKRGAMTKEQLKIFQQLWETDKPEFHGEHYDFDPVGVAPEPVQDPRFPIWTGGEGEIAVKRAAIDGDAWFPYLVNMPVEEFAAKCNRVQEIAEQYDRSDEVKLCCCAAIDITEEPVEDGDYTLEGTPEQLRTVLQEFQEIGVEHIALQFLKGRWPERKEKIERFAEEVMPSVK